ncbi:MULTISPECIES: valine--tRNA ligase [unclassified Sphingomonas]|uniref:valine--tRNA ligase n=1 Tax=unclassified Sphingomonas TaxID=196159 RepID=UPI0021514DAF|nr:MULTISPECIES: valine--tRNA ligase [unclassified Sphingomonas]MCR5872445.1 valine--tRNA ligase [Sphingomonas sp. J344]UUX99273.1 valine--tRNA ligase [Sphingomonas sp. J315]
MSELPKTFDPADIEQRWYAYWESNGLFRPERPGAQPWTIVNPPPNVTGSLHIGHALDNTLQDILVRHARLKGMDARWVVGMDHAGIATQMVVERQLNERQQKRTNFTREEFVAKVWEWKAESGGAITGQLRRLGCSMDWSDERFTMDEGFSKAVLKVFVDLHKQGLIYRDKRLVNWDPGLGTAISDLEVETREVAGKFWHLRYPLADGSGFILVATTRPETMLADMAVAVHPTDERYAALVGKQVKLPITGRLIPIVADEHADPELGSGAVKITPGHDFNDFEVGRRAGIEARDMLNMLDAKAMLCQTSDGLIPAELIGLDRFDAREKVVARLKDEGFLVPWTDKDGNEHDAEPRKIQTPFGDRSGVVIEPWLTDQWYVDAATLAKPAIEAVRSGATKVVPKSWEKTYFNWMENIQPWCVSRQLWWGHRIPAWFAEDGSVYVAENEAEAQAQAGEGVALTQDEDVLDTWFSSALWPFATLGWPENDDPTLGGRYPNDVLISGFDILFFWDARMMMQGLHFMKEVPFKTLYLHGLVRAADGAKMSKSKGNVVDPLGLIDQYGADALRFFMAAMESQGRDVKMDEKRVEGYRNFATKLWNAARFAQSNGIRASEHVEAPRATLAVNKWIIAETVSTVQAMDIAFADHRFDGAANTIYQFTWSRFCDWYLELIKPVLQTEGAEGAEETRQVAGWVLDQILVMLHPFMPFITEELWSKMGERPDYPIIAAKWPMADARALDPEAAQEIDWLIRLVSELRAARTELNVPPGARLALHVRDAHADTLERLARQNAALSRLARVDRAEGAAPAGGALQIVVDEATYVLPLEGVIDLDAERARLTKAIAAAEKERDSLNARLSNPAFAEKAKPEAVEKARADHAEKSAEAARLGAALGRLG